ncbi:hypothetical protein R5H30_16150 [Sulfitobacter sp. D35]|uniref:hypothetical protein n=1 Tax=Sulfitobacter sp. D35 TaxID=3083252 RepID=UPI00296F1B66|nr:hypothetical protein [Sulfitobacter sp. D35]MDW4499526.1 hypothetical protein [Sulfitobacter sp. D35]
MKHLPVILSAIWAATAQADTSCSLRQLPGEDSTTLLLRELVPENQAIILVSGRTLTFDCPAHPAGHSMECYGKTAAPMAAPTQLNVSAGKPGAGAVAVVTTRNLFYGRNPHIGTHRRHVSVHVFRIEGCERG